MGFRTREHREGETEASSLWIDKEIKWSGFVLDIRAEIRRANSSSDHEQGNT